MPDSTPNLGEPDDVRQAKLEAKVRKREADAVYSGIMQHAGGRRWMYDLLGRCGVYTTSFDRSALQMSFLEGQRNIGLALVAEVTRVCPELYVQMLKEQNNKDLKDDDGIASDN